MFFIYSLRVDGGARSAGGAALLVASPLLLVPAIWAKYWVFALFSWRAAVLPLSAWAVPPVTAWARVALPWSWSPLR